MDNNSLAHTTWNCKYHIVFAPKYRRQIIYGKIKAEGLREDVLPCLNGLDKCHTCAGKAGVRA